MYMEPVGQCKFLNGKVCKFWADPRRSNFFTGTASRWLTPCKHLNRVKFFFHSLRGKSFELTYLIKKSHSRVSLPTADAFPVVASLPPKNSYCSEGEKRRKCVCCSQASLSLVLNRGLKLWGGGVLKRVRILKIFLPKIFRGSPILKCWWRPPPPPPITPDLLHAFLKHASVHGGDTVTHFTRKS